MMRSEAAVFIPSGGLTSNVLSGLVVVVNLHYIGSGVAGKDVALLVGSGSLGGTSIPCSLTKGEVSLGLAPWGA